MGPYHVNAFYSTFTNVFKNSCHVFLTFLKRPFILISTFFYIYVIKYTDLVAIIIITIISVKFSELNLSAIIHYDKRIL